MSPFYRNSTCSFENWLSNNWSYSVQDGNLKEIDPTTISISFGATATDGILNAVFSTFYGTITTSNPEPIIIQGSQFCTFNNCVVNKLNLDASSVHMLESLDVFMASDQISAEITFGHGRFFIFRAGEEITLRPGFEVAKSTILLAEIRNCFN